MIRLAAILIMTCLVTGSLAGGTIQGFVRAEGPGDSASGGGKYDSRKFKFVEKVNYDEMRDFVVWIEGPLTNSIPETNRVVAVDTRRVLQQGANFTPGVLPIVVGTTVEWPNNDDIYHNVFSMSEPRPFDLGLYKGNPPEKRVTFDKPGRIEVFCSIHANMHCTLLVLENPYFAATDVKGHYTITNVPPGTYQLKAWHERLPSQTQSIVVPADGVVKADFKLGFTDLPKI